jgi:phosphoglycolate phosphatase
MYNLIFDYDGTLHEGIKIYAPAFKKAQKYLLDKKLIEPTEYSDGDISVWLGFTAMEMWQSFAPDLPEEEKQMCSRIIGEEMVRLTLNGEASLYPNAKETLSELKRYGFNLLFLSNCKTIYMEAHKRHFLLGRYFSEFYCSEDCGFTAKHEIFKFIKDRWQGEFIVIGDRYQDMEIAEKHGLESIGCLYGYGKTEELQSADYKIMSIEEILPIVKNLPRV